MFAFLWCLHGGGRQLREGSAEGLTGSGREERSKGMLPPLKHLFLMRLSQLLLGEGSEPCGSTFIPVCRAEVDVIIIVVIVVRRWTEGKLVEEAPDR